MAGFSHKPTKQTVIDFKNWAVKLPTTTPKPIHKLIQENKLKDVSPGLPDHNFKRKMKAVGSKEKAVFLAKFDFNKTKQDLKPKCKIESEFVQFPTVYFILSRPLSFLFFFQNVNHLS